jgi:hypothetical protein
LGSFLTGKQENRGTGACKSLGSAGLGIFLTGKQENLEQENVKVWARRGLVSRHVFQVPKTNLKPVIPAKAG